MAEILVTAGARWRFVASRQVAAALEPLFVGGVRKPPAGPLELLVGRASLVQGGRCGGGCLRVRCSSSGWEARGAVLLGEGLQVLQLSETPAGCPGVVMTWEDGDQRMPPEASGAPAWLLSAWVRCGA